MGHRRHAVVGVFERQLASDRIGYGDAKNASRFCRSHAVGRVFERDRFIGAYAKLIEHRQIRSRIGLVQLGILETFGRMEIVQQLQTF